MADKFVYFFGEGKAEGTGTMKEILGGKGAGLAEMTNAGVPVPPGFTITTEVCKYYYENGGKLSPEIEQEIAEALARLEKVQGKWLGDAEDPLLISVRSGAKFSMPGMMDSILNLGMNDRSVVGIARRTANRRFAFDAYRRFIQMFGNVVLGIEKEVFEHALSALKESRKVPYDTDLTAEDWENLVGSFKGLVRKEVGTDFPQDPKIQLALARNAVFKSWMNPRAITYRRLNDIPEDLGTAVTVQAMVFGNLGETSGTGVGFTRSPATGKKELYGEFLMNAQGEDVVSGVRTPRPIADLKIVLPAVYQQLVEITQNLENHYRDVQDFEFTIQNGKLFMLQTRNGKRTGHAAVKIACDMVGEGLITKEEALLRVEPQTLDQLLHPIFDPKQREKFKVVAKGLPASPGAAAGQVVFTADEAVAWVSKGKRVLLVRMETAPDDIHGMNVAQGVLTATGGMTSHAAVVGRQMGKPAVVGCIALKFDSKEKLFTVNEKDIKEGDFVSIDGATGEVMLADVPTAPSEVLQIIAGTLEPKASEIYQNFAKLLSWAEETKKLGVRANADIPKDAKMAFAFGAQGIGLCRTEHMFFAEDRLPIVQKMILADNPKDREKALKKLLPLQREDFYGLFKEMKGYPVTIRTLDPPLHEFLPKREELLVEIAKLEAKGTKGKRAGGKRKLAKLQKLLSRVEELHEFNPMLGLRGCRLGITYPEITRMQAQAIFEAASKLAKQGGKVRPEVMIPLVGHVKELVLQKAIVDEVAEETMAKSGVKVDYSVGTMIEVPRGAITADEIAKEARFFSFGTNDLTQMTFAFSRDDAGKFIHVYVAQGILEKDPFQTLDRAGVGTLVRMGVEKGRKTRPDLKVGICGEHGGDPASIEFCHQVGLDYVSCSPYRVPIARLAAAQAVLKEKKEHRKVGD